LLQHAFPPPIIRHANGFSSQLDFKGCQLFVIVRSEKGEDKANLLIEELQLDLDSRASIILDSKEFTERTIPGAHPSTTVYEHVFSKDYEFIH
jgi:hypothetical protein